MLFEYNENNLYDINEGYLKGNMFKNLYAPYKDIDPLEVTPLNNEEKRNYELMMLEFAINDLTLYLLVNDDEELKNKLKDYKKLYYKLINEGDR